MFYVSRGNIPPKRHTQHRAPDGRLYAEELFGVEGFTGRELAALPPRRRRRGRTGSSRSARSELEEADDGYHRHRLIKTGGRRAAAATR